MDGTKIMLFSQQTNKKVCNFVVLLDLNVCLHISRDLHVISSTSWRRESGRSLPALTLEFDYSYTNRPHRDFTGGTNLYTYHAVTLWTFGLEWFLLISILSD